jgi:hypothetical protein
VRSRDVIEQLSMTSTFIAKNGSKVKIGRRQTSAAPPGVLALIQA